MKSQLTVEAQFFNAERLKAEADLLWLKAAKPDKMQLIPETLTKSAMKSEALVNEGVGSKKLRCSIRRPEKGDWGLPLAGNILCGSYLKIKQMDILLIVFLSKEVSSRTKNFLFFQV